MKPLLFSVALFLVSLHGFAQKQTFNQGGPSAPNYYSEIPYQANNGKLFVSVRLSGKKHKFLFDTGAPVTISKELATELKSPLLSQDTVRDINGNTGPLSQVRLDSIRLGDITFTGIPSLVGIADFYSCWQAEGVVGSNLLRGSIVSINSERHVIIITDQPGRLALNKKQSVPMISDESRNRQSKPAIQISLNGKVNLMLNFDTGDNGFLHFTDDAMKSLARYHSYKVVSKGYGSSAIGQFGLQADADKYLLEFPLITIGNARFDHVIAQTNRGGTAAIGSKLLDYGNVTLDFVGGRFYFEARQELNDLSEKQWPMQPTVKDGKLVVSLVWEKGKDLAQPGEQIIAIEGKDFSQVNFCELLNNGPVLGGKETAALTLKDAQGKQRLVQISKQ